MKCPVCKYDDEKPIDLSFGHGEFFTSSYIAYLDREHNGKKELATFAGCPACKVVFIDSVTEVEEPKIEKTSFIDKIFSYFK